MTADLPGLLIGVDSNVREIGYKLYKWIGDPNRMQYPNAARFAKIPAEVFTICKLYLTDVLYEGKICVVFSLYS